MSGKQTRIRADNQIIMRNLLILVALSWSVAAVAQEPEVWACLDSRSSGLQWDNRRWVQTSFRSSNFILTMSGARSSISVNGDSIDLECAVSIIPQVVRCHDILGIQLLFNTVTHVGTYSSIVGGVIGPGADSYRENIEVRTFQCIRVTTGDSTRPR